MSGAARCADAGCGLVNLGLGPVWLGIGRVRRCKVDLRDGQVVSGLARRGFMKKQKEVINNVSNGGSGTLKTGEPYAIEVTIEGVSSILFHRWNCDSVEAKAKAAKGSKGKKEDDLESYVYRLGNGNLGLPGEYLRQSIIHAAKFKQDPRSTRKSAMDLYKAGVQSLTELADFGVKDWDFVDRRRVTIQRNGITRYRPALNLGWQCTIQLQVTLPEYIPQLELIEVINSAGRLVGVGDFRPTFGRFVVQNYQT